MSEHNELNPCPFCGCVDVRKMTGLRHSVVWCGKCGASITRFTTLGKYERIKDAEADVGVRATEDWNRRANDGT